MDKQSKKKKSVDRAKRRSESQRIGQEGEFIFQRWAVLNGLNPHRAALDIGIDFFCERLMPVATGAQETTGVVLVAQVRSTARENRPCVKLERTDVLNALRMQQPYGLFAVSVETDEVWFRLLDETLFDEFTAFLTSKKKHLLQYVEHMQRGSDRFAAAMRHVSRPAFRNVLEQQKAQARLEAVLPDAAFQIRGGAGGYTLVTVPSLISIFHIDGKKAREQAMEIFFTPQSLDATFESAARTFYLHEPFEAIQDLALGPMVIVGEGERLVKLFVEHEGTRVESDFLLRRIHDERAYIGSSGLVLRIGDARRGKDGRRYHPFRSAVKSEGALDLASSGQIPFLKLLRAGARVNEVGREGVGIEYFQLQELGAAVDAIEGVFTGLKIPLTDTRLADLTAPAFGRKIGFLEAILDPNATAPVIPTFVIGVPDSHSVDAAQWRPGEYRLPIVLNLAGRGIIVRIYGNADGYLYQNLIHGFRFRTAVLEKVETLPTEHPNVSGIEAWVYKDWPAVPLTDLRGRQVKVEKHASLPFGGQFSTVREASKAISPVSDE